MVKKGIAWWTDKHVKFRNPGGNENLTAAFQGAVHTFAPFVLLNAHSAVTGLSFSGTSKPVNWRKPVYELDPLNQDNNGFINEDFIVWMRTAALPTFRKLYRIIQKKPDMTPTLASGNYELNITYSILPDSVLGSQSYRSPLSLSLTLGIDLNLHSNGCKIGGPWRHLVVRKQTYRESYS